MLKIHKQIKQWKTSRHNLPTARNWISVISTWNTMRIESTAALFYHAHTRKGFHIEVLLKIIKYVDNTVNIIVNRVTEHCFRWKLPPLYGRMCTLTYWGRVTHIYVNKLIINASDNGLSIMHERHADSYFHFTFIDDRSLKTPILPSKVMFLHISLCAFYHIE